MDSKELLVVLVTAPSESVAESLAESLIDARLAACVNIIPKTVSIYTWKGKRERAEEVLMILKTERANYGELESKIHELHPYDTPEVVALAASQVAESYLKWVVESVE